MALTLALVRPLLTRLLQVTYNLLTFRLITKDLFSLHCNAFLIISVMTLVLFMILLTRYTCQSRFHFLHNVTDAARETQNLFSVYTVL